MRAAESLRHVFQKDTLACGPPGSDFCLFANPQDTNLTTAVKN